jgi:hypothetical protein
MHDLTCYFNFTGPINCLPDKVSCLDNECVFKSYWCDGFVDCGDRSDEGEHCKSKCLCILVYCNQCIYCLYNVI